MAYLPGIAGRKSARLRLPSTGGLREKVYSSSFARIQRTRRNNASNTTTKRTITPVTAPIKKKALNTNRIARIAPRATGIPIRSESEDMTGARSYSSTAPRFSLRRAGGLAGGNR